MKKGFSLSAIVFLFFLTSFAPHEDFQGTLTIENKIYHTSLKTYEFTTSIYVKGNKILLDFEEENLPYELKILIDKEKKSIYQLMDMGERKVALKTPFPAFKMEENGENGELYVRGIIMKKEPKPKKIQGFEGYNYVGENQRYSAEALICKDFPISYELFLSGILKDPYLKKPLRHFNLEGLSMKAFPLEIQIREKKGENYFQHKLTNRTEKFIKQEVFDVSDYEYLDVSKGW